MNRVGDFLRQIRQCIPVSSSSAGAGFPGKGISNPPIRARIGLRLPSFASVRIN